MPSCGVRLSVCPSVTFVSCVKTNRYLRIFFTIGQPHHSSFSIPNGMAIFRREPPPIEDVEYRWGRQKRHSGRIAGFAAYRSTVLSTVRVEHTAASVVRTRRQRSVCDGIDVIHRQEVKPPPDTISSDRSSCSKLSLFGLQSE